MVKQKDEKCKITEEEEGWKAGKIGEEGFVLGKWRHKEYKYDT